MHSTPQSGIQGISPQDSNSPFLTTPISVFCAPYCQNGSQLMISKYNTFFSSTSSLHILFSLKLLSLCLYLLPLLRHPRPHALLPNASTQAPYRSPPDEIRPTANSVKLPFFPRNYSFCPPQTAPISFYSPTTLTLL